MPAAVLPSVKILRSSASVLRTISGRDTRSGPRSPPCASSPWHDAHAVSKALLALSRPAALVLDAVAPGRFCPLTAMAAIARRQNTAVNGIQASAETDRFLRCLEMPGLNRFHLLLTRKASKRLHPARPKMLKCARLKCKEGLCGVFCFLGVASLCSSAWLSFQACWFWHRGRRFRQNKTSPRNQKTRLLSSMVFDTWKLPRCLTL